MIWGMIGWDYKSPLVFLEKRPDCRGVDSRAYKEQVLEPIVFPLFERIGSKFIFIEDGSKVHKGHARLARFEQGIRTLNWPPYSPDLNPIEKVWRWMKHKINQLPFVPTTLQELKREIQRLWDEMDPKTFRPEIERLTCKLEDMIKAKGKAPVH